ncbi:MAG: hypothetical protein LBD38_02010, partial [Streptococcaceae bacterium]|nr:hypothetical protein [Streptococcaceae bacterium]
MTKRKKREILRKHEQNTSHKNLAKAGAIIAVGAGAFMAGTIGLNKQASAQTNGTSETLNNTNRSGIKDIENTSIDELSHAEANANANDDDAGVKAQAHLGAEQVANLPTQSEVGDHASVSEVKTAYSLADLQNVTGGQVYYTSHTLSSSEPGLMKMDQYRQMIHANPDLSVEATGNFHAVSPHLYANR